MFSIEYTEKEFAERLYEAIGFLGGNFRYRDSERFWNIHYFIQRCLTEECLKLELKFIRHGMEKLTGNTVEGVVVDTMGINGRKKSILGKPKMNLGRRRIKRLKQNLPLLNKIGKLLREEPTLGRLMASKKHIYVDGLNVRKIVEDLGHLILYNVRKSIFPILEICESDWL